MAGETPNAFFYQVAGEDISDSFNRLLVPMEVRLPTFELRDWHRNLQLIGNLGGGAAEFSRRLNDALWNHRGYATHDWYRAIALITLIHTTTAARQPLDSRLFSLYSGASDADDARRPLARLLDGLYGGDAEKNGAGPAAFYRIARSALLIRGLDTFVSAGLARYLKWLGTEERALANQADPAERAKGSTSGAAGQELAAALKEIDGALEGRAASAQDMQKRLLELADEMARVSNDPQSLDRVRAQYAEIATAMQKMQSQAASELPLSRVIQYLRTRMRETHQSFAGQGFAPLSAAAGMVPTSPWGWLCFHFGGLPERMAPWGWVSLALMTLAVLQVLLFIFSGR